MPSVQDCPFPHTGPQIATKDRGAIPWNTATVRELGNRLDNPDIVQHPGLIGEILHCADAVMGENGDLADHREHKRIPGYSNANSRRYKRRDQLMWYSSREALQQIADSNGVYSVLDYYCTPRDIREAHRLCRSTPFSTFP